jgi:hypothetical protein
VDDLASLLRHRDSLENDAAAYRQRIAAIAALIHNPTYDYDTRAAFAHAAGLPGPRKEHTPCPAATSPGGPDAPHTTGPVTSAEPAAPTSALAAAGTATTGPSAP